MSNLYITRLGYSRLKIDSNGKRYLYESKTILWCLKKDLKKYCTKFNSKLNINDIDGKSYYAVPAVTLATNVENISTHWDNTIEKYKENFFKCKMSLKPKAFVKQFIIDNREYILELIERDTGRKYSSQT